MHLLYLTGRGKALTNDVAATAKLREVGAALADTGVTDLQTLTHSEAHAVLVTLAEDGVAFVAGAEPNALDALREFKDRLRAAGFAAQIDPDVGRLMQQHKASRMTSEGATPEGVFAALAPGEPAESPPGPAQANIGPRPAPSARGYQTALALMAPNEGHPLSAATTACNLLRTTGDPSVYQEAVDALLLVFPWIKAPLIANGLINPDMRA